jgi:O-antigen/teichoic acid export membrane protein
LTNDSKSSYKQILKATSIFGGVQVINILISLVRSKFIAVLLGPIGIGISGMLTATTGIISGLTNFGLGTSAVRDISAAYESGNTKRIAIVTNVLNHWVSITGVLGMILTLLLSPWLSYLSFGNYDYTIAFLVLSITLLINQLNSGQVVVLQGSRKISLLAKANLAGSVIGLFTTIPLYYVWGINGIVPALVIAAIVSLLISYYFRKKIVVETIRVSKVRSIAEGKKMLKMGFSISMSGFITLGFSYLVRIFITREGNLAEVGLYNAGFAIISTYVGLIFSAMGTDYYSRLSAVADDLERANDTINNQIEISIMLLGPILVVFILFIKWIILIIYSTQFLAIGPMLVWAAIGILFKAVSWCMAYFILSKGASKLFFWNELIANLYLSLLNIIGYYYFGLSGLGYAFIITYLIYMIQVYLVIKFKFEYKIRKKIFSILLILFLFTISSLTITTFLTGFMFLFLSSLILISILIYTIIFLSRLLNHSTS